MILNVKISPKTGNMATLGLQAIGCMFQVQGVLPQGTRKLSIYLSLLCGYLNFLGLQDISLGYATGCI